jgi:cardiolipin synthase
VFGWAFAWWGTALYWWAGWLYVRQVREVVTAARAEQAAGPA